MDASLSQVDWNTAAKKPGESLTGRARELREETRRALLTAFAPTMILNEWASSSQPDRSPQVMDLPDLHPVAALGVTQWVNETSPFPHDWWLSIWRIMPSIKAKVSASG